MVPPTTSLNRALPAESPPVFFHLLGRMSPQHPREEAKLRRQKAQFRRRSLDLVVDVVAWRQRGGDRGDDLVFSMGFSWWFHGDVIGLGFNGAKNLFKILIMYSDLVGFNGI